MLFPAIYLRAFHTGTGTSQKPKPTLILGFTPQASPHSAAFENPATTYLKPRKMEVERLGPVLRERGDMGPPAKKPRASEPKKTVSAAAIFKQHNNKSKRGSVTPQTNLTTPMFTVEGADATTLLSVKSHSRVHSSSKAGGRVVRKRSSDMHPLGVTFRGSRQHCLYLLCRLLTLPHRYYRLLPPAPLQHHQSDDQQDALYLPPSPLQKYPANHP
jgi:hypothetical protein